MAQPSLCCCCLQFYGPPNEIIVFSLHLIGVLLGHHVNYFDIIFVGSLILLEIVKVNYGRHTGTNKIFSVWEYRFDRSSSSSSSSSSSLQRLIDIFKSHTKSRSNCNRTNCTIQFTRIHLEAAAAFETLLSSFRGVIALWK